MNLPHFSNKCSLCLQTCRLNAPISNVPWWFLVMVVNIIPLSRYLFLSDIKKRWNRSFIMFILITTGILFELLCYFLCTLYPWINAQLRNKNLYSYYAQLHWCLLHECSKSTSYFLPNFKRNHCFYIKLFSPGKLQY